MRDVADQCQYVVRLVLIKLGGIIIIMYNGIKIAVVIYSVYNI